MSEGLAERETFWRAFVGFACRYKFRPHTGNFGVDLLYILVLIILEESLVGSVFGWIGPIDLVSTWLMVNLLRKKPAPALFMAVLVGLVQESRSSVPAGTYLCIYWILAVGIVQLRPVLSWRFYTPWVTMFCVTQLALELIKWAILAISSDVFSLSVRELLLVIVQVGVALGFGLWVCQPFLGPYAEEPTPQ